MLQESKGYNKNNEAWKNDMKWQVKCYNTFQVINCNYQLMLRINPTGSDAYAAVS